MKINVKGAIIPNSYKWVYQLFEMDYCCPADVESALDKADNEDIEVHINSGGGSVSAGVEIYTLLKSFKGNVTVKILGMAGSAASVIAMAGDKVLISPPAQVMIHCASVSYTDGGNYRDMDKLSEILQQTDKSIINAYRLKTKMSEKELKKLMDAETYMTAQDALKYGFVDEIMFDNEITLVASTGDNLIPEPVINKLRNLILSNKLKDESGEYTMLDLKDVVEDTVEDTVEEIAEDIVEDVTEEDATESIEEDATEEDATESIEEDATEEDATESIVEDATAQDALKYGFIDEVMFDNEITLVASTGDAIEDIIEDTIEDTVEDAQISSTVALLTAQLAEKEQIIKDLEAANAELLQNLSVVDAYRADLIETALTLGVRLQGNAFKKDIFNKFLSSLSIDEIKDIISGFEDSIEDKFSSSRKSESNMTSNENIPNIDDEEEFRDFVAIKASEYSISNNISIAEATKIMYNKYSMKEEK